MHTYIRQRAATHKADAAQPPFTRMHPHVALLNQYAENRTCSRNAAVVNRTPAVGMHRLLHAAQLSNDQLYKVVKSSFYSQNPVNVLSICCVAVIEQGRGRGQRAWRSWVD
jgi:hypothetical protein